MDPILLLLDPDPGGEGGAGDGAGAGDGEQERTTLSLDAGAGLLGGTPTATPTAKAGDGGDGGESPMAGDAMEAILKSIGGRFDSGDHQLNAEYLAANPHVGKLAQAYQNLESEYGKSQDNLTKARAKSIEAHGIADDAFQKLNFSVGEEGGFGKDTVDALLGKVITQETLSQLANVFGDYFNLKAAAHATWKSGVSEKLGFGVDDAIDWANNSGFYDAAQLKSMGGALADPGLRDAIIGKIAQDYVQGGMVAMGLNKGEQLEMGNSAGYSADDTSYSSLEEYTADRTAAHGDPSKLMAADAKLKRSHRLTQETAAKYS